MLQTNPLFNFAIDTESENETDIYRVTFVYITLI